MLNSGTQFGLLGSVRRLLNPAQQRADAAAASAAKAQQAADAAAAAAQQAAATQGKAIAIGLARLAAALIVGSSADVVVPLSRTMPSTGYALEIPAMPGVVTVTEKSRTTSSVTLTLKAGVALAVGFNFSVTAWA